jgi:thiosulfate dehydrogenase
MKQAGTALLFLLLGILIVPVVAWCYLSFGHPPVAVDDPAFPMEQQIVHGPLNARIEKELPGKSPVPVNETTLTEAAGIYVSSCAFCHGVPNKPSKIGQNMYPDVPQLWERHHGGAVVGVSDDPVGETYWKVKNGIRLTGMPSYAKVLTDAEIWEVSNLLAAADKPLSPAVQNILAQPVN